MPIQQDIFEIERKGYMDLKMFAVPHANARPFFGCWQKAHIEEQYDFIFYDPFEYIPHGRAPYSGRSETAASLKQILKPSGYYAIHILVMETCLMWKDSTLSMWSYSRSS